MCAWLAPMALSKTVDLDALSDQERSIADSYGARFRGDPVPRYELPADGMPARATYQAVYDELALDGNPMLNLATFVTTWMEPEADQLMAVTVNKNSIDQDEYPQTVEIQNRCVNIIARLFNAPATTASVGTATVGSSEAIHLAGLALKWRWRKAREAAGKDATIPNLVMSASVQVCWEKFARYFDVEPRFVPNTTKRHIIDPAEAASLVDENTIGVVGILGSTYTGEFEPIADLARALDGVQEQAGHDVPIHVDAASGGFVAPFTQPELEWDFRIERVASINASGHKFGLVYPGIGWGVWRDEAVLPDELIFHTNYLGGDEPTFDLNFSRGGGQIIAQYYNFLRLGRAGYTAVMERLLDTTRYLANLARASERLEVLSTDDALPLVCFRLSGEQPYDAFDVSHVLRERGWIVPAYTLAPNADDITVLRVVVKESLTRDLADLLVADVERAHDRLEPGNAAPERRRGRGKHGVC